MAPAMITVAIARMPSAISIDAVASRIAERLGDAFCDRRARGLGIEREFAAEEALGIEPAEHEIGVGDGRLGAAAAVADRPRRRAGALRTDMQALLLIEPGDRAAARADLDDVDHRRLDRKAFHVAAGVIDRIDGEAAVLDQRAFGRRAAHVESDDIVEAERLGIGAGADAAADRTRFDEAIGWRQVRVDREQRRRSNPS